MAHKVFICHSSKDKAIADAACAALEAKRISCWIAPRDILAGDEYGKSIIEALSTCQVVLLIFSRRSNDSPQCRREIERAVSKERIIVPFRIENVMPSDAMEFALSNTHWLDAITPPLERRLNELCETIGHLLQRQGVHKPLDMTGSAAGAGSVANPPFSASAPSQAGSKRPLGLIFGAAATVLVCGLGIGGALRYAHRTSDTPPRTQSSLKPDNPFVTPPPPSNPKPGVTKTPIKNVTTPIKKPVVNVTPPVEKPIVPVAPPVVDHGPPLPPPMTPEQKARLDQVEMKIDDIGSGAESANNSLKQLQDQMSQQHLSLNGKWTELQAGMNNSLSKARAALKEKDPDKAERYAAAAASDLGQIKTFLGR